MSPVLLSNTHSHRVWRMSRHRAVLHTVAEGGFQQDPHFHKVWQMSRHRSFWHTLSWVGEGCRGSLEVTY